METLFQEEKMKIKSVLVFWIVFCSGLFVFPAQHVERIELSLKDCIVRALEDNLSIAVQAFDPEISDYSVRKAKEIYYPQLSFTYDNYYYNRLSNWAVQGTNYQDKYLRYNVGIKQKIMTGGGTSTLAFQHEF